MHSGKLSQFPTTGRSTSFFSTDMQYTSKAKYLEVSQSGHISAVNMALSILRSYEYLLEKKAEMVGGRRYEIIVVLEKCTVQEQSLKTTTFCQVSGNSEMV